MEVIRLARDAVISREGMVGVHSSSHGDHWH